MAEYVTHDQAAELLGVVRSTVIRLVKTGQLSSAGPRGPGRAGLRRAEVEALMLVRQQESERRRRDREAGEASREAARARRERRAAQADRGAQPPDADHEWLTVQQAAEMLGVFRQAVQQSCFRGKMPFEWSDGHRWIRRDLLELRQRARVAQATRRP